MWYIGDDTFGHGCFIVAINDEQGIPELDYTVRRGEHKPLYFNDKDKAKAALRLFKKWCKANYGAPQHRLMENPKVISVPQAQLNLF